MRSSREIVAELSALAQEAEYAVLVVESSDKRHLIFPGPDALQKLETLLAAGAFPLGFIRELRKGRPAPSVETRIVRADHASDGNASLAREALRQMMDRVSDALERDHGVFVERPSTVAGDSQAREN